MAQFPIVQNLHEEFVLYVVMVDSEHTIDQMCEEASKANIAFERNHKPGQQLRARRLGAEEPFDHDITVADAGITAMMSLEFYYED